MGLKEVLAKLTSPKGPRLVSADSSAPHIELSKLEVHTAERLVIVTTDPGGAGLIRELADAATPATLSCGPMTLHIRPTTTEMLPVKDPLKGWIIGFDPNLRRAILETLKPERGDYELGRQLAIIVE